MSKNIFQYLIGCYNVLRRALPRRRVCVFYPTCSEYAFTAIGRHGAVHGIFMAARRIFRCHPWQKEHYDPVK